MRTIAVGEIRSRLDVTQDELAQLLGVHSLTISKWERGRLHPNPYQTALLLAFRTATIADPTIGRRAVAMLASHGVPAALHTILHTALLTKPG